MTRPVVQLTERELETLNLLSHGYDRESIARYQGVVLSTVKFRLRGLFPKIGARNRSHAVRRGFELGLLKPCPKVCRMCNDVPVFPLVRD